MRLAALLFLILTVAPLRAEEVDLELLLLVDVSRSMSPEELEIQRQGYARALTSDAVAAALGRSLSGRIALAYVEWAGEHRQTVLQDWALIAGRDDLAAFAAALLRVPSVTQSRTSIASALRFGAFLTVAVTFLSIALVLFSILKVYNRATGSAASAPPNEIALLTEIRDELRAQRGQGPAA